MKYKVYYEGYYLIEADSMEDALETSRDDYTEYEEWENTRAEKVPYRKYRRSEANAAD